MLAGLMIAASVAQDNQPRKKTAREVYKNIKVFPKDLPADQVIPIMHKINDSLGVKCDFCHVIETTADGKHVGWEKDDKKMKSVAREMITMTSNMRAKQKFLKNKASCYMCHHGKPEPETNAPEPKPGR
jgi:hypothetical protein